MKVLHTGTHCEQSLSIINNGRSHCIVFGSTAYVFKPSSSRYGMTTPIGLRMQFVCQDACCDAGVQQDVADIVEKAKELGATRVVLRMGQYEYRRSQIAGLPVEDVSNHVGELAEGLVIDTRR